MPIVLGPRNRTGSQGEVGPQGERGLAGRRGSIWFFGDKKPDKSIGQNDDFYLEKNGYVWQKKDDKWSRVTDLQGPQGIKGEDGRNGFNGAPGIQGPPGEGGEGTVIELSIPASSTVQCDSNTLSTFVGISYDMTCKTSSFSKTRKFINDVLHIGSGVEDILYGKNGNLHLSVENTTSGLAHVLNITNHESETVYLKIKKSLF